MALSMTGFGRGEAVLAGCNITAQVKAVNHRYFEYTSHLPRSFAYMDEEIKKLVAGEISRGKVEVSVSVQNLEKAPVTVAPNMEMAKGYHDAMKAIAQTLSIDDNIDINTLARFGDIFVQTKVPGMEEETEGNILTVLQAALAAFATMRAAEGEKLAVDILARLATIEGHLAAVEETSAQRVEKYRDKLYQKMQALLGETGIEESRILQEAAIYADKTAVDEETVRLHSHIAQYRSILKETGPIGKKLDFLTQELNREVNTIGSKASEVAITRLVVEMKAEIEKIREQVQNIE